MILFVCRLFTNDDAYWQSDGAARSHWIRSADLHMDLSVLGCFGPIESLHVYNLYYDIVLYVLYLVYQI